MYEKVNKERCMIEIESMITKYRLEIMKEQDNALRTDNINIIYNNSLESQKETVNIKEREYHYDIDNELILEK